MLVGRCACCNQVRQLTYVAVQSQRKVCRSCVIKHGIDVVRLVEPVAEYDEGPPTVAGLSPRVLRFIEENNGCTRGDLHRFFKANYSRRIVTDGLTKLLVDGDILRMPSGDRPEDDRYFLTDCIPAGIDDSSLVDTPMTKCNFNPRRVYTPSDSVREETLKALEELVASGQPFFISTLVERSGVSRSAMARREDLWATVKAAIAQSKESHKQKARLQVCRFASRANSCPPKQPLAVQLLKELRDSLAAMHNAAESHNDAAEKRARAQHRKALVLVQEIAGTTSHNQTLDWLDLHYPRWRATKTSTIGKEQVTA